MRTGAKENLPAVIGKSPVSGGVELESAVRKPIFVGFSLCAVFLGGALAWGSMVAIPAGAVAPGVISPDSNRRTVQHFEGGIIASLKVREGAMVTAGQPLVLLESVQASSAYEALSNQHRTLLITRALPNDLAMQASTPEMQMILKGQQSIFETRRSTHDVNRRILNQRIAQSHEQILALSAQVASATTQLELIAEELSGKEQLSRRGIIPKPEVLRIQRMQAEIMGRRGEYQGTIARVHQQIGEAQSQLLALDAQRADQISTHMDQVRLELSVTAEKLTASRDVLSRTVVTAPVTGTVVNMRVKTEGGVVLKGEPILDIVPAEDKLLIDARVAPTDIDVVHIGLPAVVHLTAFSNRGLPRLTGIVRMVSADRLQDSPTSAPYFLARVEVNRGDLDRNGHKAELVSGMPAEVLIVTAERTMIEYLIEPFRQAFWRSFREV
jgi:HlyD family secretion protein